MLNCSIEVVSHHLHRGMCFWLTHVHEQSTWRMYPRTLVAAFDPGSTRNRRCNRLAHPLLPRETKRWLNMNCAAAAWMLVASNMICLWSNTAGVMDSNNLSRKVTVNHTWFTAVLRSTTFYHRVSWSLHQSREAFFLFNSLPNALFIVEFSDVSGRLPNQYTVYSFFLFLLYMKFTMN